MRDTIDASAVPIGTNVYASDDEHLGTVTEVGPNYLLVEKGTLFRKDFYVPFSAVTEASPDGVILNVSKDDVESGAWDEPPLEDESFSAPYTSAERVRDTSPG